MGRRGAGTPHPLSVYPMAGGGISRPPGKNFHLLGSMGRDRICRMGRIGLEKGFWGTKGQKGEKGAGRERLGTSSIKTRLCLSPLHALSVLLCGPCQAFQSCKSRKSCRKCPRQRQRRGWRTTGNGAASPWAERGGGSFWTGLTGWTGLLEGGGRVPHLPSGYSEEEDITTNVPSASFALLGSSPNTLQDSCLTL